MCYSTTVQPKLRLTNYFNTSTMKFTYAQGIVLSLGILIGALGMFAYTVTQAPTAAEYIGEYYETENAVAVSPHTLRTMMDQGRSDEFVIVDLRSSAEYEAEHVISAINIPAFVDPATDEARIVAAFEKVIAENPNEDIITYCYSHACMLARKVGLLLSSHGIYVKHLNIGWNEWRHDWQMWNSIEEASSTVESYIHSGTGPGVPEEKALIAPCSEGDLTC